MHFAASAGEPQAASQTSASPTTRSSRDRVADQSSQLNSPAYGAEPLIRPANRLRQDGAGIVARLARRERDPVGDLDVGQAIAGLVADLVGVDIDIERFGLGPPRRQDVYVDSGAAADRDHEQLGRSEVLVLPHAERNPATA